MERLAFGLLAVAILMAPGYVAGSTITNPGFETGDLSGWTLYLGDDGRGSGGAASVHWGESSFYTPIGGSYFAVLWADGTDSFVTLSQTFSVSDGETISGWAAFDYRDYAPFQDRAMVQVFDSGGNLLATPWKELGPDHPDYWDGPPAQWSWESAADQEITLVYSVANGGDPALSSAAIFDDVEFSQTTIVPEPTALLLWSGLGGFAAAMAYRRKRRAA